MSRVLFLNDNSAHENWGAQATPPSLKMILNDSIKGCQLSILSHSWLSRSFQHRLNDRFGGRYFRASDIHWRLRPLVFKFSRKVRFYPEVIDDFDYWADRWLKGDCGPHSKDFLDLARESDIVVYNGENSLYRNTPEGCHGLFLLYLAKTRLNKPACLVNHTSHFNEVKPILRSMALKVYPQLDLVAVRESASKANLESIGIHRVESFPDVAFYQSPDDSSPERVEEFLMRSSLKPNEFFCLSASGLPASMPRGEYDGEITKLVRRLKQKTGLQSVLVAKDPWCLPLKDVAERTGSVFFGPEYRYQDLWHLFRESNHLITGHYHYAIFAAMVGCPFVPLSVNNHKMRGLCEMLEWHLTNPFDSTGLASCSEDICMEATKLMKNRVGYRQQLSLKAREFKEGTRALGQAINKILTGEQR